MKVLVADPISQRPDLAGSVAVASDYLEQHLATKPADLRPDAAVWAFADRDGNRLLLTLSHEEIVASMIVPPEDLLHPVSRDLRMLQAYGRFLGVKSDRQRERVNASIRALDESDEVIANAQ